MIDHEFERAVVRNSRNELIFVLLGTVLLGFIIAVAL